jgi:zinc protease
MKRHGPAPDRLATHAQHCDLSVAKGATYHPVMARSLLSCLPFLVVIGAHAALASPGERSDLTPDPAAHLGALPNGIRYVIKKHPMPPNRAALRLLVLAGSKMETDRQRGLAHFIEHLSMDGTTHFPPGTYLEHFQRLGMHIGSDTNAFTSSDRTFYKLDLPNAATATIADGLLALADCAGGMLLLPEQIEKERGIVLREKLDRDSSANRAHVAEYTAILGAAGFAAHDQTGSPEVILHAPRAEFVDFYDTWYRPERMVVVAVGDFEVGAVEKQIVDAFTALKPRAPARAAPAVAPIETGGGLRIFSFLDRNAPNTTVAISSIQPEPSGPDTLAARRDWALRELATAMLDLRLRVLSRQPNAPFIAARAGQTKEFGLYRETTLQATCSATQWASALTVLEHELRRAYEDGFSAAEVKRTAQAIETVIEQEAQGSANRWAWDVADEIVDTFASGRVLLSPEQEREVFKSALGSATPESCLATFRRAWEPPNRWIKLSGNADGTEQAIRAAYRDAQNVAVAPPSSKADETFGYTDFGHDGKVVRRSKAEDLDVTLVEFANGVRLNLKPWDASPGRILIRARVGTGKLTEPADKPGLREVASRSLLAGGLGKHSLETLLTMFVGTSIGCEFFVGSDALTFDASVTREDLLRQLQFETAFLIDPGFRPEGLHFARQQLEHRYAELGHSLEGPAESEVMRLLANGDSRFGLPTAETTLKYTLEDVKGWLAPQLGHGPIEIAMVGDLEIDAAIDVVAKTFGALPQRDARPALPAERQIALPQPFTKEYQVDTTSPNALILVFWPTADGTDRRRVHRLDCLAEILADRLRVAVRERLSASYSPTADNQSDSTYTLGYMKAVITADPPQAQRIAAVITSVANRLHDDGVTEDELARAKRPTIAGFRESMRTNEYWVGVLSVASAQPGACDESRTKIADIEAITKPEIDDLAKRYLDASQASVVVLMPKSAAEKGNDSERAPAKRMPD